VLDEVVNLVGKVTNIAERATPAWLKALTERDGSIEARRPGRVAGVRPTGTEGSH